MFGRDSWLVLIIALVTTGFAAPEPNSVNINLQSSWIKPDFSLLLLETIASFNESLYLPALTKTFMLPQSEPESDEDEEEDLQPIDLVLDDAHRYKDMVSLLKYKVDAYSFDVYLANKYYSPRVIAHYDYYNSSVLPEFGSKLLNCKSSFDSADKGTTEKTFPRVWMLYNDEPLCNKDDLFALKTSSKAHDNLLPFDRVIGSNENAPLIVFYADPSADDTRDFLFQLLKSADGGKIRFVFRYIPPVQGNSVQEHEPIGGYGADLTLKRTDYIVIDDRDIKDGQSIKNLDGSANELEAEAQDVPLVEQMGTPSILNIFSRVHEIKKLTSKQLKNIDLKLVNYIINRVEKSNTKFEYLHELITGFPKYAHSIATSKLFKYSKKDGDFSRLVKAIKHNKELGAQDEMQGIFLNGRQLTASEYNLFDFLKIVESESQLVYNCSVKLGISPVTCKNFISEYARLKAIAGARSSGEGNRKRYDLRAGMNDDTIKGEKIVYLNDLSKDDAFTLNRQVWFNTQSLQTGQLPKYKENVLEVVFAINLSNRRLMSIIKQIANMVLNRGFAHRIGILPITLSSDDAYYQVVQGETLQIENETYNLDVDDLKILDRLLQNDLYARSRGNHFDFMSYIDQLNDDLYLAKLWRKHLRKPSNVNRYDNSEFLNRYSITEGTVIVDGVFQNFNLFEEEWKAFITQQIISDVQLISGLMRAGRIPEDSSSDPLSISDHLYGGLPPLRNTLITPNSPDEFNYIKTSSEFISETKALSNIVEFVSKSASGSDKYVSVSIIADFTKDSAKEQLISLLKNEFNGDINIKYRFYNLVKNDEFMSVLRETLDEDGITETAFDKLNEFELSNEAKEDGEVDEHIVGLLRSIGVNTDVKSVGFLINSRYIEAPEGTDLDVGTLTYLIKHELQERLFEFMYSTVDEFEEQHNFMHQSKLDRFDWFDIFFSILTTATNTVATKEYEEAPLRYQLNLLDYTPSFSLCEDCVSSSNYSLVDMTVIIDPLQEKSQKIISLLNAFTRLAQDSILVHMTILLTPTISLKEMPVKRFYRGAYLPSLKFNEDGTLDESPYQIKFKNLPSQTLFTMDLDVPHSWIALAEESKYDMDNIKLDLTEEGYITSTYQLENIIVEGYSSTKDFGMPPKGLQLELSKHDANDKKIYSDTNVMVNFGYFQLKANPGVWDLSVKANSKSAEVYSFTDVTKLVGDKSADFAVKSNDQNMRLAVLDLSGLIFEQEFAKNPGYEQTFLGEEDDADEASKAEEGKAKGGFLSGLFKKKPEKPKQADINIFAVASGHLYERLLSIMTASVRNHTEHSLKFWLIDNYMSANFKAFLPRLAEQYNFEYELITYKWPLWLRSQREKQRTIWGYKILFLDVLFPQDLDKVIFVDADQIIRTDLKELIDEDLHGAPYGYTPMCDSRKEMEGFRFWKQGYWKNLLSRANLKYHISALYVVDLKRFRAIAAGDRLRQHYHQLSADPNSLSNLDQDLPNNMQYSIKIHSLDQNWLWCETWCDDESLSEAKTIDLCNNPLTKEPKLDRARRQIPEWSVYDKEIGELMDKFKKEKLGQPTAEVSEEKVEEKVEEKIETATDTPEEPNDDQPEPLESGEDYEDLLHDEL